MIDRTRTNILIFDRMISVRVRASRRVSHHAALQALSRVEVRSHVAMVAVSVLGMVVARLGTGMRITDLAIKM